MKGTKVTEVAKEIIDKNCLKNWQLAIVLDRPELTVRTKKSRETYTFEDVVRLCYYAGEDLTEKAHYIFGDDWFDRISKIDKQSAEILRLKREIAKLKGQFSELENEH